jgi:APA family basic amino acid/polyamine antiporter
MTSAPAALRSRLGLGAVAALVVGDMLGSGIFFTPGELAAVARQEWQVYFIWALAGFITLCGALTLGELCSLLPRAGASYHFIREGFGPFWAFLLVWINLWVGGPGSVAGLAASMGEFLRTGFGLQPPFTPVAMGSAAIVFFVLVNLAGVEWGGRTQIVLTVVKLVGIAALVVGGLWLPAPALETAGVATGSAATALPPTDDVGGWSGFARFTGLGIAAVLFTYDGWIDVSHVAGEVRRPERNLPKGLALGVGALTLLYLVVNLAYLRVVPIETMRQAPTAVASNVAAAAYGPRGGALLNVLVVLSMFGAMGGLVMTLPRLYYAMATEHSGTGSGPPRLFFRALGRVASRSAAPAGAILFTGAASIVALGFFGSFSKLANFVVVPLQLGNILMVASIFRLRCKLAPSAYRTPGYPVTPLVYIVVMLGFLASALMYRPVETLIGLSLSATGVPVYFWLRRKKA